MHFVWHPCLFWFDFLCNYLVKNIQTWVNVTFYIVLGCKKTWKTQNVWVMWQFSLFLLHSLWHHHLRTLHACVSDSLSLCVCLSLSLCFLSLPHPPNYPRLHGCAVHYLWGHLPRLPLCFTHRHTHRDASVSNPRLLSPSASACGSV